MTELIISLYQDVGQLAIRLLCKVSHYDFNLSKSVRISAIIAIKTLEVPQQVFKKGKTMRSIEQKNNGEIEWVNSIK